jgi:ribonuclease G
VTRQLLIAATPGELRAAMTDAGELVDFRLVRTVGGSRVGEIHLGRVVRLLPALRAALVDIGLDRPAFLSADDSTSRQGLSEVHEGASILVQVKRDARADKAAAVTLRVRLAGEVLDWTPTRPGAAADEISVGARGEAIAAVSPLLRPGEGVRLHAASVDASPEMLAATVSAQRARWETISERRDRAEPPRCLEVVPPLERLLRGLADETVDEIVIDDPVISAEVCRWLVRFCPPLVDRLIPHRGETPLFETAGIADSVAGLFEFLVPLSSGGAISIEPTSAATLIDVDSGSLDEERSSGDDAALEVNLRAAVEIARQIRLRGLAGAMVVDFITLRRREHRERLLAGFAAAMAAAALDAQILGWTRLGNIELTRPRRGPPLHEIVHERTSQGGYVKTALTVALDALAAAARQALTRPGRALVLRVHPSVAAILDGEAQSARQGLGTRLGRSLAVVAEPTRAREAVDIGIA